MSNTYHATTGEIMQDVKNNKEKPWKQKKERSGLLEELYVQLDYLGLAERVNKCASLLWFKGCPVCTEYKKLFKASFCGTRLCPVCNWRRSSLLAAQSIELLHKVVEVEPKIKFVYMTLTMKRVTGDELGEAMNQIFYGIQKLMQYKEVDKAVIGWLRTFETNYDNNPYITKKMWARYKPSYKANLQSRGLTVGSPNPSYRTYNPHFNVIMGVKPGYFTDYYIRQSRWVELWQRALNVDYPPSVVVKRIRPKNRDEVIEMIADVEKQREISINSAINEVAKYVAKDTDYLFEDGKGGAKEVVRTLTNVLKGRQLIGYGKLFLKLRRELRMQNVDSEDADLVNAKTCDNPNCELCGSTLIEEVYGWDVDRKNYIRLKSFLEGE